MRQRPFCVRCRQRGDSGAELVVTGFGFILFLDAGGCTSLCGNWFVRPYIESRYFADHNMLGSATTKIRLPHRLVTPSHAEKDARRSTRRPYKGRGARRLLICAREVGGWR